MVPGSCRQPAPALVERRLVDGTVPADAHTAATHATAGDPPAGNAAARHATTWHAGTGFPPAGDEAASPDAGHANWCTHPRHCRQRAGRRRTGHHAQQTSAPKGPHLPSNKQAPTVSSNPYGSEPKFDQPKKDPREKKATHTKASKTTSRWNLWTIAAWVAVVVFGVTTAIAGGSYTYSLAERTPAVQERDEAQRQYDRAQKELDQAKKELEELQQ